MSCSNASSACTQTFATQCLQPNFCDMAQIYLIHFQANLQGEPGGPAAAARPRRSPARKSFKQTLAKTDFTFNS